MSTHNPTDALPELENVRIAVVAARWNSHITDPLTAGAVETLTAAGLDPREDIDVYRVPGAV
ncbi:MAG: 6,7-dimethyl-8-ribityllumazine synthase, partial [Duncaniella sp.]|nr:6,7-dimethyl-8-ribityllumazine synthase [Duncaniella sp.]